jgi:hypothetical protein
LPDPPCDLGVRRDDRVRYGDGHASQPGAARHERVAWLVYVTDVTPRLRVRHMTGAVIRAGVARGVGVLGMRPPAGRRRPVARGGRQAPWDDGEERGERGCLSEPAHGLKLTAETEADNPGGPRVSGHLPGIWMRRLFL